MAAASPASQLGWEAERARRFSAFACSPDRGEVRRLSLSESQFDAVQSVQAGATGPGIEERPDIKEEPRAGEAWAHRDHDSAGSGSVDCHGQSDDSRAHKRGRVDGWDAAAERMAVHSDHAGRCDISPSGARTPAPHSTHT